MKHKTDMKDAVNTVISVVFDALIYVFAQIFVQFCYAFVIYFRNIDPEKSLIIAVQTSVSEVSSNQLLLAFISVLISLYIILMKHSAKEKRNVLVPDFQKIGLTELLLSMTAGFSFSFSVYAALTALSRNGIYAENHVNGIGITYYLVVCFLAPVVEEFLFRNVILHKLLGRFSVMFSVILQAFLFALIHATIQKKIYTFLLGCLLGAFAVEMSNILIPVIVHITFNIIGTGVIDISSCSASVNCFFLAISIILFGFSFILSVRAKFTKNGKKLKYNWEEK